MDKFPRKSLLKLYTLRLCLFFLFVTAFLAQAQTFTLGGQFWIVRDRGPEQLVNRLPVPVNVATPGHYRINGFILYNSGNHQLNESFYFTLEDAAGNEIVPVDPNAKPHPYKVVPDDSVDGKHIAWRDGGVFYIPQANTDYTLIINHYARIWDDVPYFINPRLYEATGRNAESLNIQKYQLVLEEPYQKPDLDAPTDLTINYEAQTVNTTIVDEKVFPAVGPGEDYLYQVAVENTGPNNISSFRTWVNKPDTVEFSNFSIEPAFFAFGKYFWDLGALNQNDIFNISYQATASNQVADLPFELPSIAGVYSAKDTTIDNNFDSTTVYITNDIVPPTVDVSVTQFSVTDSMVVENGDTTKYVDEGESYQINITLTNNSLGEAQNVVLSDTLPANVIASNFNVAPLNPDAPVLSWNLPALAPQTSTTFQFMVQVPDVLPVGTNLFVNNVYVIAANEHPDSTFNNTATDTVFSDVAPKIVDLGLSQVITTDSMEVVNGDTIKYVKEGETFQITLLIENPSGNVAENVVLGDKLPTGLVIGNYSMTPNLVLGDSVIWDFGDIPGGEQRVIQFEATVPDTVPAGHYVFINSADLSADNEELATITNNTVADSVVLDVPQRFSDIALSQMAFTDSSIFDGVDSVKYVQNGGLYQLKISISNVNDNLATNINLTNNLPEQVSLVSADPQPAITTGQLLEWNFATLGASEVKEILLTLQVSDSAFAETDSLVNNATVVAENENPDNLNDNSSTSTVYVVEPATVYSDVRIRQIVIADSFKVVNGDTIPVVKPGETYEINIIVTNLGPIDAEDLVITDIFPDSGFVHDFNITPDVLAPDSAVWNIAVLPGLEENIFKFFVTLPPVMPEGETPLPNKVDLAVGNEDPNLTGDNSSTEIPICIYEPPTLYSDVIIWQYFEADSFKVVDGDSVPVVKPGETYTVNIKVRNRGQIAAEDLVITDVFPDSGTVHSFNIQPNVLDADSAIWNLSMLPVNGEEHYQFLVTLPAVMPEGETELPNRVGLVVGNEDPNLPDDNSSVGTPICIYEPPTLYSDVIIWQYFEADSFRIANGDTIPIIKPGETYTVHIKVRNRGQIAAEDLVITDVFPDSGTVHSFNIQPNVLDADSVIWNLSALPVNGEEHYLFLVTLPAVMPEGETEMPNRVGLVVGNEDPNLPDDNSSVGTPICIYEPLLLARVIITHKVLTGAEIIKDGVPFPLVVAGEEIQFVITVKNLSEYSALNLTLYERIAEELTILGFTNGGTQSNQVISWLIPTLGPFGEMVFVVDALVPIELPEGENEFNVVANIIGENVSPDPEATSVPIIIYNQVYPAIEASIRTNPTSVEVSDSIYVDVMVSGPVKSYDVWAYLPNGQVDSTFADSFIEQNSLNPNEWKTLIPAFVIDYLITTNKEDPVTFEIRALDMNGALVTSQAISTIKSGNYLVLDRNVYEAEQNEPLGIRFKLSNRRVATLDVYTINGRHITQITRDVYQGGWNLYPWNGQSSEGQRVGSGVYLVVLRSGEFNDYKKFILVR